MKKMIFAFLALAAAASAYASKIDDAIKQAEQESEAARAIINQNPFAHSRFPSLCAPGLDTSQACSDAQFVTQDKGAVSRYLSNGFQLAVLKNITKLDSQEKATLIQLLNAKAFHWTFIQFYSPTPKLYARYMTPNPYASVNPAQQIEAFNQVSKYFDSIKKQFKLTNQLASFLGTDYYGSNFAGYIAKSPGNKKFILDLLQ